MLMPPLPPGKPGAVGPYWDPLSLEHRLPRNLVLVIYVSVAPGSSPFRRIPETIDSLPHPSEECKQFVKPAQNFHRRDIFTGEYAAKRGRC